MKKRKRAKRGRKVLRAIAEGEDEEESDIERRKRGREATKESWFQA